MSESRTPARRRRASAPRESRGLDPLALVALALVLLAAVAVLATPGGDGAEPSAAAPETGQVVEHTLLACPDLAPARKVDAAAYLGLAPASVDPDLQPDGSVQAGPVGAPPKPLSLRRGQLTDTSPDVGPRAEANGAAGLFGARSDTGQDTLAVTGCPEPRAQWWFTAAGAGLDHGSTLDLANVDPGPAVIDLTVLGPDGPVDTVGTKGITLAPGAHKRIDLAQVAPQTDDLALEVHAERGRVVAAVDDRFAAKPGASQGQEWLAGTDRASRVVRLSGVPTGGRSRDLYVANPGDLEAIVTVRVSGKDGTFSPTGLDSVTVPPGSVQQVDLTKALPAKEATSVRVASRTPVLAVVRTSAQRDHAYATPVLPLEAAAAALLPKGVDTSVQVTAGSAAAKVTVTAYDATGRKLDGADLSVAATATADWTPSKTAVKKGGYVIVQPDGNAHVHGAVTYEDGSGMAATPLVALPIHVERPSVRPATH